LEGDKVKDPDYGGPNLQLISDVLRYIFNFIPCFPQARATMALMQVQEENLKCVNQIDEADLGNLCDEMVNNPSIFATDEDGKYGYNAKKTSLKFGKFRHFKANWRLLRSQICA